MAPHGPQLANYTCTTRTVESKSCVATAVTRVYSKLKTLRNKGEEEFGAELMRCNKKMGLWWPLMFPHSMADSPAVMGPGNYSYYLSHECA